VAGADPAVLDRLGQGERDRGGRGIGMLVDGDDDFLRRQMQALAHAVDDPPVGLVRHQPVDVALRQAIGGQRLLHRLGEPYHGVAKHLATVHHQMARLVAPAHRTVDIQDVALRALGVQMGGKDAAVHAAAAGAGKGRIN